MLFNPWQVAIACTNTQSILQSDHISDQKIQVRYLNVLNRRNSRFIGLLPYLCISGVVSSLAPDPRLDELRDGIFKVAFAR